MMAHTAQKKRPKRQARKAAFRRVRRVPLPACPAVPSSSLQSRPQNLPLWAPDGVDLEVVPAEVRQAVAELVQPLYDQFVIGAADGLEKSLGVTITHLLWLEILEQFDLKQEYTQVDAVLKLPGNRHEMIDRHLRLIDSKLRVGYFLVRIRELRRRISEQTQVPPPVLGENQDRSSMRLTLDMPSNILPSPPAPLPDHCVAPGEGRIKDA